MTVTRYYTDQAGGDGCVWNTPHGDGCKWSDPSDADTIALCRGGNINPWSNFGFYLFCSFSSGDGIYTFQGHGGNYSPSSGGTVWNFTGHIPTGAKSASGTGGTDEPFLFIDDVTPANRGIVWQFGPTYITNLQPGQGPFTTSPDGHPLTCTVEDGMSMTFAEDFENQHAGDMGLAGLIRGYDIGATGSNPTLIPGTSLTRINHKLRFTMMGAFMKTNVDPNNPSYSQGQNGPLLPNSWPQYYEDFQNDPNNPNNQYTGDFLYGSSIGIPANTPRPAGLSNAGIQWWDAMVNYGAVVRDAGGNNNYFTDGDVPDQWQFDLDADFNATTGFNLVQYLRVLRNQHVGNGSRILATDINGPGNRICAPPPPLAPLTGVTPSADQTVIVQGSGALLTNLKGDQYGLDGYGRVTCNGVPDASTWGVNKLAYVKGLIWQNAGATWWGQTSKTSLWQPPGGTTTSPLAINPPPSNGITPATTQNQIAGVIAAFVILNAHLLRVDITRANDQQLISNALPNMKAIGEHIGIFKTGSPTTITPASCQAINDGIIRAMNTLRGHLVEIETVAALQHECNQIIGSLQHLQQIIGFLLVS